MVCKVKVKFVPTHFARSNAGIMGSNSNQGTDVCIVCVYSVCVVLCVGRGLTTG
jgi:hypothetical protein